MRKWWGLAIMAWTTWLGAPPYVSYEKPHVPHGDVQISVRTSLWAIDVNSGHD